MIGNSIWLLSFLLFVWQFVLLDDVSRNTVIAGISQYYMYSFIALGTIFTSLFSSGVLSGTVMMIFSYVAMLLVNLLGFIAGKITAKPLRNKSNMNQEEALEEPTA